VSAARGDLSDAAGITSHPVDERSKCPCSPPRTSSIFPNSDQRLPGQLLRQGTPSPRASTIAALQRVRHPPGCSDAACSSASRGRSLK